MDDSAAKEAPAVHVTIRDEAILSAAIWFPADALGLHNIYYRDQGSGGCASRASPGGQPIFLMFECRRAAQRIDCQPDPARLKHCP